MYSHCDILLAEQTKMLVKLFNYLQLFLCSLVESLFICLPFAFVLLEQGVQDLQGGRNVLRDNFCRIIHRKELVFIIRYQRLPSHRGSGNMKKLLPTLANRYSHNPSLEVIEQEDRNNITCNWINMSLVRQNPIKIALLCEMHKPNECDIKIDFTTG